MKLKIALFFTCFVLLFASLSPLAAAEGETPPGNNSGENNQPPQNAQPIFIRVDGDKTVVGNPGDSVTINLNCMITGDSDPNLRYEDAYILYAYADARGSQEIYLTNAYEQTRVNPGYAGYYGARGLSGMLSFNVRIPENAKPGTYPVDFKIGYEGKPVTDFVAYVRVEANERSSSRLKIGKITLIPTGQNVQPGDHVVAGIEITNPGDKPVYNGLLRLDGLTDEGFSLARGFNTRQFAVIQPGETKRVTFELIASDRAKAKNYEFTLTLQYDGQSAPEGEKTPDQKFYITVKGNSAANASALVITNLKYPLKTLYPGNTATLTFDLTNKGKTEARRVMVKSEIEGSGFVNRSVSQQFLESLAPGETKSFSFTYYATPGASTQNYPVHIKAEYRDGLSADDQPQVTEQIAGFFVNNPQKSEDGKDQKKATPKLIIDRYEFEPKLPAAGSDFKMKLSFFNTNPTKTVKNIKILLTSTETTDKNSNTAGSNIFTPVDSSNTFYIDSIGPKQSVEKEITLYTVPDAVAKTYTVTANFEYEDSENNEYKATEEIGIPVVQASKLEVGQIQLPQTPITVGEGTPITVDFYNTGKVTLYNMMVKFESETLEAQNSTYYIGNFLEGSTENYEVTVTANTPGEQKGEIVFSYEDSSGKKQEVRKEIKLQVEEAPPVDPNADPNHAMPSENEGSGWKDKLMNLLKNWKFWVGAVLAASLIGFGIRKAIHKKREKDLTLDE